MRFLKYLTAPLMVALIVSPEAADAKKKKKKIGIIEGRVVTSADAPLADVELLIEGVNAEEIGPSMTGKDGEFSVEIASPEGEYQINLSKQGYADYQASIPLDAGSRQNVVITLIDLAEASKTQAISVYNQGAEAFRAEDLAAAKTAFLEANSLDPQLPPPLLGLADIYLREEAHQEAATAIDAFLELVPDDHQALRIAYNAYQALEGEAAAARLSALEEKLVELGDGKNLAIDHHNRGVAAVQTNDYAASVAAFEKAIELDPSLVASRSTLALVLYNLERFDEALAAVDGLLGLEQDNVQAHRVRLLVYDARDETEEAMAAFDSYAALDARGASQVLYQRADLDFRRGSNDSAEAALLKILEVAPEFPRAHYSLGLVYASSDVAKSKQHLEKFLKLAPDDPEAETARSMLAQL